MPASREHHTTDVEVRGSLPAGQAGNPCGVTKVRAFARAFFFYIHGTNLNLAWKLSIKMWTNAKSQNYPGVSKHLTNKDQNITNVEVRGFPAESLKSGQMPGLFCLNSRDISQEAWKRR